MNAKGRVALSAHLCESLINDKKCSRLLICYLQIGFDVIIAGGTGESCGLQPLPAQNERNFGINFLLIPDGPRVCPSWDFNLDHDMWMWTRPLYAEPLLAHAALPHYRECLVSPAFYRAEVVNGAQAVGKTSVCNYC